MDDNSPGFPCHPSLLPQYSTYIFITKLFTSKPSSVYPNSRVPSISYRISTWHTLVYTEHSMVPQKKWSKILSYRWILLIHRTSIQCCQTFCAIMSKHGSSQSRNVWTQHIFCSLLIIEWWEGNKMNINKQEQWKTQSIHLSTLGRLLRIWGMQTVSWLDVDSVLCGEDSLPIVLQGPWIPFQHILICPLYPLTIFNGLWGICCPLRMYFFLACFLVEESF